MRGVTVIPYHPVSLLNEGRSMSLHRTRVLVTSLALAAAVTAGTLTTTAQAAVPVATDHGKAALPVAAPDPASTLKALGALGAVTQQVSTLATAATAASPAPSAADLQSKLTVLGTAEQMLTSAVPAAPALPVGSPAKQTAAQHGPGLAKGLPVPVPVPVPDPTAAVPSVLQTALTKLQSDATALVTAVTSKDPAQVLTALTTVATDTVAVVSGTVTALGLPAPV